MFKPDDALTVKNAKNTLEAGLRAIAGGQAVFDLGGLAILDSAAVTVLLAWKRAALARGVAVQFNNFPANLQSLTTLYGVADLLGASSSSPSNQDEPLHH